MKEVQSATQPHPKLDPRLGTLVGLGVKAFVHAGLGSLETEARREGNDLRRAGPFAFSRGQWLEGEDEIAPAAPSPGAEPSHAALPPKVPVFLRAETPDALRRLAGSGVKLISQARTIATTELSLPEISKLEEDPDVAAIEWTGAFRPVTDDALDTAPPVGACAAIRLDPQRIAGVDGRGVVMGIVDVEGLDLYHPAFVRPNGRTQVQALWDQRASRSDGAHRAGQEIGPGGLGVVYRRDAIGLEISSRRLVRGAVVPHRAVKGSHGTLTASLAVGNGDDRADARGIAPGADLVFVNTFGSGPGALGAMTELADAIAFTFREASRVRKPCVVNLSLGDDLGPRDGTSPIEAFIDELLGEPGRAVVIAAGNSHGKKRHARAALTPGDTATLTLNIPRRCSERAVVEIWYDAGDAAEPALASLDIEAPAGAGRTGPLAPDGLARAFDVAGTRLLVISMPLSPARSDSGRRNGVIRIEMLSGQEGSLLDGPWRLHLGVQGRPTVAHACVDHRSVSWAEASQDLTLTTPATARRAIVVGAHDAKKDRQAWFSGRGEDRGGARRPDLLAPGGPLVSAWAESTVRYTALARGTSVAAPIASGVAALIFQRGGPELSADHVRAELASLTRATGDEPHRTLSLEGFEPREPVQPRAAAEALHATAHEAPSPGGVPRIHPRDPVQIIEDHYMMYAEVEAQWLPVGEVLVLPGTGPDSTVEHWKLDPAFRAPGPDNTRAVLQFRNTGRSLSLKEFVDDSKPGARHIQASCEVTDIGPARAAARTRGAPAAKGATSAPGTNESHEPAAVGGPTRTGSDEMATKNYLRPLDRTQIIEGRYALFQDSHRVGSLLVIDEAPGVSTEHWLLHSEYQWPSETIPTRDLVFHYVGRPTSVAEFLREIPSGTTYVVARCEQQALPLNESS